MKLLVLVSILDNTFLVHFSCESYHITENKLSVYHKFMQKFPGINGNGSSVNIFNKSAGLKR